MKRKILSLATLCAMLLIGLTAHSAGMQQCRDPDDLELYEVLCDNGKLSMAGYDSSTGCTSTCESNPISSHHSETTVASVTNGTDGTYYYYLDMDGYRELGLQLILDGGSGTVTVTVECTVQDDGTAPASCTYNDVTSSVYGSASFTASTMLFDTNKVLGECKYVRVVVVASTAAANDADWTIYAKRLY